MLYLFQLLLKYHWSESRSNLSLDWIEMLILNLILVGLYGFLTGVYLPDKPLISALNGLCTLLWFVVCLLNFISLKKKLKEAEARANRAEGLSTFL